MGGHLGGQPETSDDQHHTTASGADEPDITPRARRQIRRQIDVGAPDEPVDGWTRSKIGKLAATVQRLGEDLEAHLERNGDRDMRLTEDRIADHATAQGWPIAACGEPCGFVATSPDGEEVIRLLHAHVCAHASPADPKPVPSLARLVVVCATFIAVLIIIGLIIEDLAGVK